jgi:hypothetical protein
MFLLKWYKEYLDIKNEQRARVKELQYCEACETMKLQLALANQNMKDVLDRLLAEDAPAEEPKAPEKLRAVMPTSLRWGARQQMMEAEDRERAKALRNNPAINAQPSTPLTTAEIEKELGVENG